MGFGGVDVWSLGLEKFVDTPPHTCMQPPLDSTHPHVMLSAPQKEIAERGHIKTGRAEQTTRTSQKVPRPGSTLFDNFLREAPITRGYFSCSPWTDISVESLESWEIRGSSHSLDDLLPTLLALKKFLGILGDILSTTGKFHDQLWEALSETTSEKRDVPSRAEGERFFPGNDALEASNALNPWAWGVPAVLSKEIPGNALREFLWEVPAVLGIWPVSVTHERACPGIPEMFIGWIMN